MKKETDALKLFGRWRITARNIKTGEVIVKKGKNLIVTAGKVLICEMLQDTEGYDTGLTYCAIGTDNTAPAISDTVLGTEAARKAVTRKYRSGNELTFSTFFTAAECTYDIQEAGMFGHSTAGAAADSGILFNHWLAAFDNSGGLYDLTFDSILTIG